MFHQPDLIKFIHHPVPPRVVPELPRVTTRENWPPDYTAVYAWRMAQLAKFRADKELGPNGDPLSLWAAKQYYKKREHRGEFIMHWMDTYDPRVTPKWMPFVFFPKQMETVEFINALVVDRENGLIEKCRDVGVTWVASAWSVAEWLFEDGTAIGWGSRKEDLVDQAGIPDSIFEKLRLLIGRLPKEFQPRGWNPKKHSTYMKLLNPENKSTIAGEGGDNIGRGGRKSIYFKDESAHYERPEKIEAALGDNTDVQVDISSVNGIGNVFYRRAQAAQVWTPGATMEAGQTRKLVIDWRDHPKKTQEWYDKRKARSVAEGMAHIFAQEVDRDYAASMSDTIIPAEWIKACIDADKRLARLGDWTVGEDVAGLDVADGGIDKNSLAHRKGVVLKSVTEWGERDTGVTTRRTLGEVRLIKNIRVYYDCIGVGAGVKAEYNRILDDELSQHIGKPEYERIVSAFPRFFPWSAGDGVLNPWYHVIEDDEESPFNRDMFVNLKAQAWWSLRTRFWKTFQCLTDETVTYPIGDLISLSSAIPLIHQLVAELAQPTRGESGNALRMVVDKKPDNTKSPNLADAVVMAYFPLPIDEAQAVMARYG